ncbi:hypothetical protein LguiA_030377 [Lonicera macranthoides]
MVAQPRVYGSVSYGLWFESLILIVFIAIVLPPFVAVAIRPRPGVWEYICVNVYELSVDQLGVSEYLCFKEEVVDGRKLLPYCCQMIGQWCWNVVHSDVEWVYFGCGVMENGVSRKIEETDRSLASIIEVDCPCVTPEVVLKASSHVDKFTNIMVKDEKTHTCYSAEYLIKDFCKEKLEKDANISSEKLAELNHMLAALDQMIFLLKN